MTEYSPPAYDVIIAGGGLVGASLAVALGDLSCPATATAAPHVATAKAVPLKIAPLKIAPLKIALVEALPVDSQQQASYDERTIALTYSSKLIFSALQVWQAVAATACPIERIHISNRGHFGICNLACEEVQTPALGYVCPTRTLGKALYQRLAALNNVTLLCPSTVAAITPSSRWNTARLANGDVIRAKLIVIADGGRSNLLAQAGFITTAQDYASQALLAIVAVDRPHHNVAYERFTPAGPLALLPLTGQRYAAVWTATTAQVAELAPLDDAAYLRALQDAFGYRAGLFSQPTARQSYPLQQSRLDKPAKQRVLVLGNAAHTVHPVGGQGFNLGLRDVAAFAQLLTENAGAWRDLGDSALLEQYCAQRVVETQRVVQFTHGLLASFSHPSKAVGLGRNLALSLIEHLPLAKRYLLRRTMGLASGNAHKLCKP